MVHAMSATLYSSIVWVERGVLAELADEVHRRLGVQRAYALHVAGVHVEYVVGDATGAALGRRTAMECRRGILI